MYADKRNYDLPTGFGDVFVKFLRAETCAQAAKSLDGVLYGGTMCETAYWVESMFDEDKFDHLPQIEQNTMGKEFEGLANLPIEFVETR
jgi:hypothetical protein